MSCKVLFVNLPNLVGQWRYGIAFETTPMCQGPRPKGIQGSWLGAKGGPFGHWKNPLGFQHWFRNPQRVWEATQRNSKESNKQKILKKLLVEGWWCWWLERNQSINHWWIGVFDPKISQTHLVVEVGIRCVGVCVVQTLLVSGPFGKWMKFSSYLYGNVVSSSFETWVIICSI